MSTQPVFPEKNSEGEFYPPFFVDAAGRFLRTQIPEFRCIFFMHRNRISESSLREAKEGPFAEIRFGADEIAWVSLRVIATVEQDEIEWIRLLLSHRAGLMLGGVVDPCEHEVMTWDVLQKMNLMQDKRTISLINYRGRDVIAVWGVYSETEKRWISYLTTAEELAFEYQHGFPVEKYIDDQKPEDQFMYNYKIAEPYKSKPDPKAETRVVESQSSSAGTEKIIVNFVPKAEARKPKKKNLSPDGFGASGTPPYEQGSLFD